MAKPATERTQIKCMLFVTFPSNKNHSMYVQLFDFVAFTYSPGMIKKDNNIEFTLHTHRLS